MHDMRERTVVAWPPVTSRRIVVGVDSSDAGWQALCWAAEEAADSNAHLTVCQALVEPVHGSEQPPMAVVELLDPTLARHVREVRNQLGGDRVDLKFRGPDPVAALLDPRHHADLLVVGAAQNRSAHEWLGAAVGRLAARTACPLVVVRSTTGHAGAPFAGHVVVGVDGSSGARAALRFGYRFAARYRMPLAAVHVSAESPGDLWFDERLLETHFAVEPPALAMLANEIEALEVHDPDVVVKRAAFGGEVPAGLLRASAGAALLVVGRTNQGTMAFLRPPSVREALAYQATCTLAVIPDAGSMPGR